MPLAYAFDGSSLYQVDRKDDQLTCQQLLGFTTKDAVLTCFAPDVFYFIERDSLNVLRRWEQSTGYTHYNLPGPACALLAYRCKVYCCGINCLYAFDPLCAEVEVLNVNQNIVDIQPAEHGFLLMNDVNELYAFHFNQGITKVPLTDKPQLIGHYNRLAVVMVSHNRIVGVSEHGEVKESPVFLENPSLFVSVDGDILTSTEGNKLNLRTKNLCFSAEVPGARSLVPISIPPMQPADSCSICFCEFEGDGATLDCGHCFHRECIAEFSKFADTFIEKGEHIVFNKALCPGGCGSFARHAAAPLCSYVVGLKQMTKSDTDRILRIYPHKTVEDLLFYLCHRCKTPFFGGEKWCFRTRSGEPPKDPSDLVCSNCNDDFLCSDHQHRFVLYKCRYCCSPATHLSFGNRYMCEECQKRWEALEPEPIACPGPGACPLGGSHRTDGSYPLGCMLCMGSEGVLSSITFSTT